MTAPAPSPFSPTLANFQTTWDSTSLGWLKNCPAYYHYQMILKWQPLRKGLHLAFGGFYASGVEHFFKERAKGLSHDEAVISMVKFVLSIAGERDADGIWHPWNPDPDHPDAKIKNRYTLIRTLVWNVEDRKGSAYETIIKANGKPAIEESFNFFAFSVGDEAISLSGHLDAVVKHKGTGDTYILDDKTTKSALNMQYFKRYAPDNQVSLYSIAGKIVLNLPIKGVLIRAAQILVEGSRFATQEIPRNHLVLEEWLDDTKYWVGQAQSFARDNRWPRNDKSCNDFGGCAFHAVCNRPASHRPAWLREDFVKREWNPLEARGE
jgi:hypothetical protein